MWVITFKLIDDVVTDMSFSNFPLACDFWNLLMQRNDLIFASRVDWFDSDKVPFPEVDDEREN